MKQFSHQSQQNPFEGVVPLALLNGGSGFKRGSAARTNLGTLPYRVSFVLFSNFEWTFHGRNQMVLPVMQSRVVPAPICLLIVCVGVCCLLL